MYCKDCINWKRNNDIYEDLRFGTCRSEKIINKFAADKFDINDMVVLNDFESMGTLIETGEMFGCIHFESKKIMK